MSRASAPHPASSVVEDLERGPDFGELHVSEGIQKEGLYFNVNSRLITNLFRKPIRSLKHRAQFLQTPFWARNGHLNTLVAHYFRERKGHPGEGYDRLLIKTKDGGTLSVDLTKNKKEKQRGRRQAKPIQEEEEEEKARSVIRNSNSNNTKNPNPFVIMVAGLGGSSTDPYTKAMTTACANRGWRSAVVCMRGTGDGPVTSGRLFSARRGSTDDVRFVIGELREKGIIEQDQPIVGIGWSLGGCIINNTVLEQDEVNPEVKFSAAAALGAPYNLHESSEVLKPFPNWIYSKRMAQGLINILKPVAHNFDGVKRNFLGEDKFKFEPEKIYASQSIKDFDEALTAPFFGFGSAREYYDFSSPGPRFTAENPSTPHMIVSALDDPIVGDKGIPFEAARSNPNMLVVATAHGGHLGWCEGKDKGCGYASDPSQASWTENLVLDFLQYSLLHTQKNSKAKQPGASGATTTTTATPAATGLGKEDVQVSVGR